MILYPAKTILDIIILEYYCWVSELVIIITLFLFYCFPYYNWLPWLPWSPGGSIFKVNNLITNTTNVQFNVKWIYYLTASWKSTWIYDLRATRIPFRLIRHSINAEVIMFLLYILTLCSLVTSACCTFSY